MVKPEGGKRLEGLGREGRIMLNYIFKDTGQENTDFINLIQDRDKCWAGVNTLNDASRSIKCRLLLDKLRKYLALKNISAL